MFQTENKLFPFFCYLQHIK